MIEWYKVPKPDKYFNFPLPDLATRLWHQKYPTLNRGDPGRLNFGSHTYHEWFLKTTSDLGLGTPEPPISAHKPFTGLSKHTARLVQGGKHEVALEKMSELTLWHWAVL